MQILYYYNPKDHEQNKGINFSPEFYFEMTCKKQYNQYSYTLTNDCSLSMQDIFTDDKIVSVSAIVGENGTGKTAIMRGLLQEQSTDILDLPIEKAKRNQYFIIVREGNECQHDSIVAYYKIEDGKVAIDLQNNIKVKKVNLSSNATNSISKKEAILEGIYKKTSVIYYTSSMYEKWASSFYTIGKVKNIKISPAAENTLAKSYFHNIVFRSNTSIYTVDEGYFWKQKLLDYSVSCGIRRILDLLYYKKMKDLNVTKNTKNVFRRIPNGFKCYFSTATDVLTDGDDDYLNYKSVNNPWRSQKYERNMTNEKRFLKNRLYWNGKKLEKLYSKLPEKDRSVMHLYYGLLYEFCAEKGEEIPSHINSLDDAKEYVSRGIMEKEKNIDANYYKQALAEIDELIKIEKICEKAQNIYPETDLAYDRAMIFRTGTKSYELFLDFVEKRFHSKKTFALKYLKLVQNRISTGQRCIQDMSLWLRLMPDISKITGNEISILHENIVILIDELDMYLHPEWQRRIVKELLKELKDIFYDEKYHIQVIFTTHSPLCLSDIPVENTVYLYSDAFGFHVKHRKEMHQTYGREIYLLLKDSFFLTNTMGELATEYINSLLADIDKLREKVEKVMLSDFEPKQSEVTGERGILIKDTINEELYSIKNRAEIIGNEAIRKYILIMLKWIEEGIDTIGTI